MQSVDNETAAEQVEMSGEPAGSWSRRLNALAVEMADMSFDEFDRRTELVDALMEARTLDNVLDVEARYLKSTQEAITRYALRVCDLYAALGRELAGVSGEGAAG